jgi:ceramidase
LAQPDRSHLWILAIAIAAVAGAFWLEPIPQDPAYHAFADARKFAGISNAWNVLTNLPFFVIGALGFATLPRLASIQLRTHYVVFCAGVTLVALGSAYYHLEPSTRALVWDRMPMTVAFMALFSAVIADRFSWLVGRALLWPSVALGITSIAWWIRTEMAGAGDLRLYGIVQFLPMLLIPLMLLLRNGLWLRAPWLWAGLMAYLAAKLAEYFDSAIFSGLGWMSGHSLKHLLAAVACACVICAFHSARRQEGTVRLYC